MPILAIGRAEREAIAKLVAYAKAHPLLFDTVREGAIEGDKTVLTLEERKPGYARPASHDVIFPGGYRACFSFEQQPPGLCSHLSISVFGRSKKGMVPSPEAVAMIAQEFGVPYPPDKGWVEEYERGEYAVNLVSIAVPTQAGHA